MKIIKLFLLVGLFGVLSCSDKVEKSMVDCLGESLLIGVNHKATNDDPLKIDFNVSYHGEHELNNSIKWDFGDGSSETLNGAAASHTYKQVGTYTVIAKVGLTGGCSFDKKETVIIK
ncbi:MAG: PKD domain-containing protein [Sphingobacterium sp.]|jgi:hypothetical protein|nr:PKD domain-containing protein [Sphingobacterium sp.]